MTEKTKKSQVWGGRLTESPLAANVRFCAGRDVAALPMADQELLFFDLWTNLAHAKMLSEVGVLSAQEYREIYQALSAIDLESFVLDPAREDVHINLEHYLVQQKGLEGAKKIHSGRSRNDQVSTDMRLYLRSKTLEVASSLGLLVEAILTKAAKLTDAVMPGFTHYQPAMPTTAAHWLTAWSQGLLRDLEALLEDLARMNKSPLGAAASFGTSWPINRERTAELLAFDGVEENSLEAISSRGEMETRVAATLAVMVNRLSQVSQDLILWTTPFYRFAKIADRYVTGSSIMPQKRNPDFAEIIRAKAALTTGSLTSLLGIAKGAMSGYNRDSQQTKSLILDLFREIEDAPVILAGVIESLEFDLAALQQAAKRDFLNAADVADWLAQQFGLSFRDCYELLSLAVKYSALTSHQLTLEGLLQAARETGLADKVVLDQAKVDWLNDPASMLDLKRHTGAPSKDSVQRMLLGQRERLKKVQSQTDLWRKKIGSGSLGELENLKPTSW
ncbi:MAG: argininosuccinate lyase [Candidatus Lambdaproteobacteria bacterium RIFOXYD1_FULL_56_27]|uniref:Argininosuccinate lyase n=1 Tax=Candidatus Lambdaproteobacteria bacterium RIFOXYD2_FULL_56_26 TaxID=1817773 RepID=A0A1F6GPT8_9PROT|nr:MAG: argininosuccinate lyase [Candidatus Lambdaproteobacteria bacterium RIFOXYD2_FULL_56_26]OGH03822.1 MAG: argininosuccinate lyase [Candidatus Lambdaproteobacteria bacterium RIFOXYC1_FULL_56_13]OGH06221.1 MAG: argininosuccinate lyase [Candidatus Lambdaproteobacteria bacterium RIFOXYD1_FULL_56_27]